MLKTSNKKNKNITIIPKVDYTYKYNTLGTTPHINTKKTDYDSIRDIVEGNNTDGNKKLRNNDENVINKIINKFQIA